MPIFEKTLIYSVINSCGREILKYLIKKILVNFKLPVSVDEKCF